MKKNKKKLAALALTGIIFLASCEKENLTEENKSDTKFESPSSANEELQSGFLVSDEESLVTDSSLDTIDLRKYLTKTDERATYLGSTIYAGGWIWPGQYIQSPNGRYQLYVNHGGQAILYQDWSSVIWTLDLSSSLGYSVYFPGLAGTPPNWFALNVDWSTGRLKAKTSYQRFSRAHGATTYAQWKTLWQTSGTSGSFLNLADNRNLVLWSSGWGTDLWQTYTYLW